MHKSATKCNETIGNWCKNKHGASKIIDTFETYHPSLNTGHQQGVRVGLLLYPDPISAVAADPPRSGAFL
jgi:hypothetical protein